MGAAKRAVVTMAVAASISAVADVAPAGTVHLKNGDGIMGKIIKVSEGQWRSDHRRHRPMRERSLSMPMPSSTFATTAR